MLRNHSPISRKFVLRDLEEQLHHFSGDITTISPTDWYNLLMKTCQTLKNLENYQEMVNITRLAVDNEKLKESHDRKELAVSL